MSALTVPRMWSESILQNFKNGLLRGVDIEGPECDDVGRPFIDYLDPKLAAYLTLLGAKVIIGGPHGGSSWRVRWVWRGKAHYFPLVGEPGPAWNMQVPNTLKKINEIMEQANAGDDARGEGPEPEVERGVPAHQTGSVVIRRRP